MIGAGVTYICGIFGGMLSTISVIPQNYHIYRVKSAQGIAWGMPFCAIPCHTTWVTYGALTHDPVIWATSSVLLLTWGVLCGQKLYYDKHSKMVK